MFNPHAKRGDSGKLLHSRKLESNNVLGAADVLNAGQVLKKIVMEAPHQKPQILENQSENLESVPKAASAAHSAAGAVKQKTLPGVLKAPSVTQSEKLPKPKGPGMPNAAGAAQSAKTAGKKGNQKPRPRGAAANHKTLPNKSNAVRAARSFKTAGAAPSQKARRGAPNAARAAQPRRVAGASANKNNRPRAPNAASAAQSAKMAGKKGNQKTRPRVSNARKVMGTALLALPKKIHPGRHIIRITRSPPPNTPAMDGEVPPYPLQDLADMDLDIMNITGDPIETALNAKARQHEDLMRKCPLPAPTILIPAPSRRQNQQAFKAGMSKTVPMMNKAGYWHPSLKEGLRPRVTQLMRNAVYTAENRMKSLTPIVQKIQELADESFTFRLGFVFPRIESQLKGIRNLYTYMMNYRTDKNRQMFIFIFYFRRAMIKYWDVVYMVDRCTVLYNQHVRDVAAGKKPI